MNLIFHQIKTDVRHFWGWIGALWLINCFQNWIQPNLGGSLPAWTWVVFVGSGGLILLIAAVVAMLVQSDATITTTAFWMTRPVRRGTIFWSKTIFIVAFILLPILLIQNLSWHYILKYSVSQHLTGTWEVMVIAGGFLFVFAALAARSKALPGFFARLACLLFLLIGSTMLWNYLQSHYFFHPVAYDVRSGVEQVMRPDLVFMMVLVCGLIAWGMQGLFGRVKMSGLLLLAIFIGFTPSLGLMPKLHVKAYPVATTAQVHLLGENDTLGVQSGSQLLYSHFRVDGLKEHQVAQVGYIDGTFERNKYYIYGQENSYSGLPRLSENFKCLKSYYPEATFWFASQSVSLRNTSLPFQPQNGLGQREFEGPTNGTFSGQLRISISDLNRCADLPLEPCVSFLSPGRRLEVKKAALTGEGIEMTFSYTTTEFAFDPTPRFSEFRAFVLYNPKAGEALVYEVNDMERRGMPFFMGLVPASFQVVFPYSKLRAKLTGVSGEKWLEGARLQVFETKRCEELFYQFLQNNYLFELNRAHPVN